MNNDFEILFVSEDDCNFLVIEILFKRQRLCQIRRVNDKGDMEIIFLTDIYLLKESIEMKFDLSDFESVIEIAKAELSKLELKGSEPFKGD